MNIMFVIHQLSPLRNKETVIANDALISLFGGTDDFVH